MAYRGWCPVGINRVDMGEAVPRLATLATLPTSMFSGGEFRTRWGQEKWRWWVMGRVRDWIGCGVW